MCLVPAAGEGRDPRREEGDRKQRSPHQCGSGNGAASAGLAFPPHTITFPLGSSIISPRSCVLAGTREPFPFLGGRFVVTVSSDTWMQSSREPRRCSAPAQIPQTSLLCHWAPTRGTLAKGPVPFGCT